MPIQTLRGGQVIDDNGNVTAKVVSGAVVPLTYATPLSLDPTLGQVFTTTTTSGVGNATINATSPGTAGTDISIVITNDASGARTITFGTNFRPASTLVGTVSKAAVVNFISDGTAWFESGRAVVL
jgi:hypothetical protein